MRRALFVLAVAAALWAAPGAFAAGWCGSGETAVDRPDAITGPQVHAVVAVPSDGPDTFAADANQLADDVTSMVTWWQGQDPTRVPRFDQADFGGVRCLDISFVRLTETAAELGDGIPSFEAIEHELTGDGLANQYKKYLVYYDGPVPDSNTCGIGAGDIDDGPAYALVRLQACSGVPIDTIATHELLHALGAVPPGDPHACPGDPGHPCDSTTDVLYPYASGAPLSALVLDYNHDDYYNHPNSDPWPDVQDSPWLQLLNITQVPLTVNFSGAGEVQSDLPGVDCTSNCTTQWDPGSQVTLTANASSSDRFVRWTGACIGSGNCALTLSQATSATAVFGPTRIPVRITVAGKGTVACTSGKCPKTFMAGNSLSLHAVPAKGWKFARWSGACKGTRPVCVPPTDFALSVHATFSRKPAKR